MPCLNVYSLKKGKYDNQKGFLKIKFYDGNYNIIYDKLCKVNNHKDIKDMFKELETKGLKIDESWF